jgi:uncharacterized protein (DUF1786 family)
MIFHRRIRQATEEGRPVLLTGVLMGGGPVSWAASDHLRAGYPLYATADAARTFNDDLEVVQRKMGVTLVSEDEAANIPGDVVHLILKDFDYPVIAAAFKEFAYPLRPDALALAVFDHGNAPPGYSDRQFRFDYLERRIREKNRLSAFAYRGSNVPEIMTRLQAVVDSAKEVDLPLMVMDTAPAAVLGATLDPWVSARLRATGALVANLGNFHCLVFRLGAGGIEGVFEHHTGEVTTDRLDDLMEALARGGISHDDVFNDKGHGALMLRSGRLTLPADGFGVAVTGPRRNMIRHSRLRPYFAVPFGDMMLAGCFGMLRAIPDVLPEFSDPILDAFSGAAGRAPWESG